MMKKILAVCAVLTVFAASASGINKIRWKEMNWRIYETENFEIYYYEGAGLLAEIAAVYAQEAFEKNSRIFNYRSEERIPLFIYENKMDFTSTNITLSPLPEGAAGFTEAFKNRVVLPGSGSFRSLRELIAHEVAHAIQYNILYGEGMRSYNVLYKSYFIPMWIMEGQAEYCSGYNGSEGEMVLRDAVIKERLLPLDMLAGFSHLEEVYLAYKQSQSIFEYIEKKYGSKKVGPFIKYFSGEVSGPGIFKNILKISRENFEDQWMYFLKKKYWAQVQGRDNPEKYGPYLTKNVRSHIVHDVGAELSPDGKNIAFISSKAGLRDIYVMRHDGTGRKRILSGLEALETAGFPISWENDSAAIWFAAGDRGIKKLFRADINTGSVRKYAVKGIEQLNSPAVSPGGRFVAFTGVDGGFSNIYIFDIKSGETVNITNNVFENGSPNWSGDGKRIVFTEERNEYTRIAVLDLLSGEKEYLTEKGAYECRYPRFISGDSVIFTSDRNGIFNLYMLDINAKKEKQLTDVPNGIFYPSAGDDFFIYSYYEDACYNIYKHLRDPVQKTASAEKSSQMRPLRLEDIVPAQGGDDGFLDHIKTAAAEIIKDEKKYTIDFSPDIVFALVGIGTD
ncbi:MAG: peptidase MA family metallohydrolase, partial [bacterium]